MKKTTTRLATTTAVLVMSAFAILLAQHDARKTSQVEESISMQRAPSEPPMPLAVDNWPSDSAVIRGNNDSPLDATLTAYENPLREAEDIQEPNDLASAAPNLFGPSVVTASGESTFAQDRVAASRTDNTSAPALQPIPSTMSDGFPSLNGLAAPGTGAAPSTLNNSGSAAPALLGNANSQVNSLPNNLPNTLPPASARLSDASPSLGTQGAGAGTANLGSSGLPGTQPTANSAPNSTPNSSRGQPGVARLGVPSAPPPSTLPTSTASTSTSGNSVTPAYGNATWPPASNSTASMSDTQRGAMVPTQFPGNSASAPNINASNSGFSNAGFNNATAGNAPTTTQPSGQTSSLANSQFNTQSSNDNLGNAGRAAMTALPSAPPAAFAGGNLPPQENYSASRSFSDTPSLGGASGGGFNGNVAQQPTGQQGLAQQGLAQQGMGQQGIGQQGTAQQGSLGGFGPSNGPRSLESNRMTATSNGSMGSDFDGSAMGARTSLVSNQPGSRFLDGSQNPVMQIQKRAPEEITVGKKTSFAIIVRNAGNAAAHDVTVLDRIPRGARFAEASPNVSPTADGLLVWKLGEMGPGDEKTINLQIIPEIEGEVGSVASVHFAAQASVRSMATAPQLDLQVDSPSPVVIGQGQMIAVTIRNTGTGVARGIRLEADIPAQLKHESGENQLEAALGDLRPGESQRLTLNVAAVQPGQSVCPLRAINEDGIQAQNQFNVDVRAPQLQATIAGPARRYLERQATYQVVINNTGTAMAQNLFFDVHLPVGLKFVSADIAQATYHPETHSVTLGLAELNAGAKASFAVSVLPVELGPQGIRISATGDLGISAEAKGQVVVEGLSELAFTIGQDNGTVEVGATTTYAVQVSNVGNQSDKNVQLQIQLPEGAKLLKVDAPVDHRDEPGRLTFAAVGEMRSRDVKTFRFQVQHNRAGNQVVRAQLTSANWPVAVVKEEGTLVYNDQ